MEESFLLAIVMAKGVELNLTIVDISLFDLIKNDL
tara:strand:- start:201 stop:305 length:105 start_codon:yes stop_codon:yes gene_type:complete